MNMYNSVINWCHTCLVHDEQGHWEFPFWKSKITPPPLSVKISKNSSYENTPYTSHV